jgi:hypothetical protein
MHGDGLVVVILLGTFLGVVMALWINIRLAKAKVKRWDFNSTVLFVMSVGNFGKKQRTMWQQKGGYDERDANVIIEYQLFSLIEMLVGFVLSGILAVIIGSL